MVFLLCHLPFEGVLKASRIKLNYAGLPFEVLLDVHTFLLLQGAFAVRAEWLSKSLLLPLILLMVLLPVVVVPASPNIESCLKPLPLEQLNLDVSHEIIALPLAVPAVIGDPPQGLVRLDPEPTPCTLSLH